MANSNWPNQIKTKLIYRKGRKGRKGAKAAKRWQLAIRQIWFTTSTFKGCGEVF
jgi:hypothetical protein